MTFKSRLLEYTFRFIGRRSIRTRLAIGAILTILLRYPLKKRLKIARRNLTLCFPEASSEQIEIWVKEHFRAFIQTTIDRGFLYYGSEDALREQIHITGFDALLKSLERKERTIVMMTHFVALETGTTRMTMDVAESSTMYIPQSNPDVNTLLLKGRGRFGHIHLLTPRDGLRQLIPLIKRGVPLSYGADMDFGSRNSIFVPFFGIPTATISTIPFFARKLKANVWASICHWDPQTGHYHVRIEPPLKNFPGDMDDNEATAYINHLLEGWIRQDVSQYYWMHRRFKTRPSGEGSLYNNLT